MSTRRVYHYTTEEYDVGDSISSRGEHFPRLTKDQQLAEEVLRQHSAEARSIRESALYTWDDRTAAERAWQHKKGTNLYELEIEEADTLHIGDLQHFSSIVAAMRVGSSTVEAREKYWRSEISSAQVERLVKKAKVAARLKSKGDHLPPMARAVAEQRAIPDPEFDQFIQAFDEDCPKK